MPVSVPAVSIPPPSSSATVPAAALGATSAGPAATGAAHANPLPGDGTAGEGRSSFAKALQAAHHERAGNHPPPSPGAAAIAGSALPPTGNLLPGSPPWPMLGALPPTSAAATNGSSGHAGDPAVTATVGVGGSGAPTVGRLSASIGTSVAGSIEPATAAPIDPTAHPLPTANAFVAGARAAHDPAVGNAASTSGGATSATATASAPPPNGDAHAALAPPTPPVAVVAQIAARTEIAAALRAGDLAASAGGEADRGATTGRIGAPARASSAGGGGAAASSAVAGGTSAAPVGAAAPNGPLAKIAAATHAAASAATPAHGSGTPAVADPSGSITDPSRLAAAALAPTPTPSTSAHASAPAHGPIDLGSHELPTALADRVTWLADQNLNGASLQVNPPHLGPVELRVSIERGHAAVWLSAHNTAAYDALQSGAPRLRELLGAHGFTQVSVDVSRQSYGDPGASRQPYAAPQSEREAPVPSASPTAAAARTVQGMLDAYA